MLLIYTHRRGFEADPVIDELSRRGVQYIRFNSDDPGAFLTIDPCDQESSINCDGRRVSVSTLRGGWFQQDMPVLGLREGATRVESLQALSMSAAHQALLEQPHIAWLSSPGAIRRAANKPLQLATAIAAGLRVPATRITNDPKAVRALADRWGDDLIVKNLATPWVIGDQGTELAFTKDFDGRRFSDDEIAFAPLIYQEKVRRRRDIRVVIVDRHVFAAAIDSQNLTDIRAIPLADADYVPIDLPIELSDALRNLCASMGLGYASIDLAEDFNSEWFFLELNVTGAFIWLEGACKYPITATIASALVDRIRTSPS